MVLNPRVELWTQISDAEHRGTCQPAGWLNHGFSSAEAEREGGLKYGNAAIIYEYTLKLTNVSTIIGIQSIRNLHDYEKD